MAERPVVICTEYRGVFFGWASDTTGESVTLRRARNCVYWSVDVKGVLGLAVTGPSRGCRIGPAVDAVDLRKVTAVLECSPAAVEAWGMAPWKS
jgi:hypothetical protein